MQSAIHKKIGQGQLKGFGGTGDRRRASPQAFAIEPAWIKRRWIVLSL